MSHVLVVDDEESICWGLKRLLSEAGHQVRSASSAEEAFSLVARQAPDLIVLDVCLPGISGLAAMDQLLQLAGPVPIIVVTAFGNLDSAVLAQQNGAFDYLTKPFDLDQISAVIRRALVPEPPAEPVGAKASSWQPVEELVGQSRPMQEVFKRIALVAPTNASVLIRGESGTGKELVARAIHRHSARAEVPLVAVNLAALSPTLVESELFGHTKGAFTGAASSRRGLLQLAHGGTVLLDEVGDVPLGVQTKLLRVLEQREVTPVGEVRPCPTEFRLISATHRDLRRESAEGRFRQDLYFRLATFEIHLPPLRERPEDIPLLANRLLRRAVGPENTTARLLDETMEQLCRRPWPGNVRELRNAVEHGALLARGGAIAPEHLPPVLDFAAGEPPASSPPPALHQAVDQWVQNKLASSPLPDNLYEQFLAAAEPALFGPVLAHTGKNQVAAAQLLGIHRTTLRKRLQPPPTGPDQR